MPDVAVELRRIVSDGVGAAPPSMEQLRLLERQRRHRRTAPGAVIAVMSLLAVVLVVASAGRSHPAGPVKDHGHQSTLAVAPAYRPTAAMPSSFLIVREVNSSTVSSLQLVTATGHVVRALVANPGLMYAENTNGLFESGLDRFAYFLDLKGSSPPGPGIGIYRVSLLGGAPQLLAYGTEPAVSADGRLLAYSTAGESSLKSKSAPVVGLVNLATGHRSEVSLASIFAGEHVAGDVVLNLAWLPASHRLAVLLGPPATSHPGGKCSTWDPPGGARCPRAKSKPVPPARSRLAIIDVPANPSAPFAGRLVWAPPGYTWNLMATGLGDDTLLMVGVHGSSASAAEDVLEIDPMLAGGPTRLVGVVPAGCYPLSLDASSGSMLCQPQATSSRDSVAIYRITSASHHYEPLPFPYDVLNAGW